MLPTFSFTFLILTPSLPSLFYYHDDTQVTQVSDGTNRRARLVHADEMFDSMSVTFYRDGIMIRRGPFRERCR